jgi:hypothetical protein
MLSQGLDLMALSNQRFVTTWTSEDSVQWRMYIIPSSVDYITPAVSSNVTLPPEFLLRDMSLETELGSIPAGLVSQVLKINVNIAALQGTTALEDLRADLLRGTTAKRVPLNSDGTEYLASDLTEEQRQFDAFNTFVLQYNDGSGYKTAFIGCQKYSADNELEITALDNVVTYTIEIYDIFRCIGEIVNQDIWVKALKPTTDTVAWSSTYSVGEGATSNTVEIGQYQNLDKWPSTIYAIDKLDGNSYYHTQLFTRLATKISTMYSAYMRAITQKLTSSFVAADFFTKTLVFYKNQTQVGISPYMQYISEIWTNIEGNLTLVGGAHVDPKMFGKYTNFYEVYRSIVESSLETLRASYTFTSGNPDAYTLTMVADNPYPYPSFVTFNQDNTYSSVKIKMLSEGLNQVNVDIATISGEADTTEYGYGKQGTSGDNSKDLNVMFHNLPIITFRNTYASNLWRRNTINSGYLLYYDSPDAFGMMKVNTLVSVFFGGEDFALPVPVSLYTRKPEYQMILEQQESGIGRTISQAMVNFLGRPKQAEATLTTNFLTAKTNDVGKRCTIDLADYNSLLESIYGVPTALAVLTKHTHKVYEGMCDITLRIDAEPLS